MIEIDPFFMQLALDQAACAEKNGEVPVGAVLVRQGELLAAGCNQSIALCDPSAHAEIVTLRQAGQAVNNYRLLGTTLYVTLEPCVMCVGALLHARVERIVYGATDPKAGAIESVFSILEQPLLNHRIACHGGVLAESCGDILRAFFRERR